VTSRKKPLLAALGGDIVSPPPWWLMRQAGRYLPEYREVRSRANGFLDLCFNPELAAEATMQPVRRFSTGAAILFSDILVVPLGLGQRVWFVEGEGPRLAPLRSRRDVEGLDPTGLLARVAPVFETVRRVTKALPSSTALIGFAGSPWTVATYAVEGGGSRDFIDVKRWAWSDPDGFQTLIDVLTEATTAYLSAQVEAGAEVVQLFDSWAGALAEPEFRRWVIEPTQRIVSGVKSKNPGVPIIGFPRGAGALYPLYAEATGVDALALDSQVPLDWIKRRVDSRMALQGNLDPVALLAGGERLKAEARRICAELADRPHVFNLGHGVHQQTPPEHVETLSDILGGRG
jgi:uroporphyrinogen decarboxylase